MRKKISLVLLVVVILFIWGNSLQSADRSGERSVRVTEIVNDVLRTRNPVTEHIIRKQAHFAEFALEGMCVVLVLWTHDRLRRANCGNVLLAGILTALIDESIQAGVAGRWSSVADVWLDVAGFVTGACVLTVFALVVRRMKQRRCNGSA
ncbi:MAG: VanZ family protein [Acetatifactor sp.]|nr:VanZ family protein [Acetatifactor sp.]